MVPPLSNRYNSHLQLHAGTHRDSSVPSLSDGTDSYFYSNVEDLRVAKYNQWLGARSCIERQLVQISAEASCIQKHLLNHKTCEQHACVLKYSTITTLNQFQLLSTLFIALRGMNCFRLTLDAILLRYTRYDSYPCPLQ